jgi:hypothetical protein
MASLWTPVRRYLRVFGIAAIFATIPALSIVLVMVKQQRASFVEAFHHEGLYWYGWALLAPPILWAARRFPVDQSPRTRAICTHLAFAVLAGMLQGVFSLGIYALVGPPSYQDPVDVSAVGAILLWVPFGLFFYSMIATVGFALDYHAKLREREQMAAELRSLLVDARLGALRMQLQPHFLFNALNTVAMLVRQGDAQTSVRVLARLAELMRQLLDDEAPQEVPLDDELEFVGRYLEIERVRFGDRLHVRIDADHTARATPVPHLLLQPLVENAIRHGIARRSEAARVDVSAFRRDGVLHIVVRDDGPGIPAGWTLAASQGIGLRNTCTRLQYLYGDDATLDITNAEGGGAVVNVVLPVRSAPAGA